MAEIIRIPDGNAFLLRVTGQIRTGDYTEDADFSVVTHMGVNFVRRGRIAQTFGLDSLGRIVIENSGNLAQGVYGVELYGYYHGEPWRNYQKNVFQIVNENANSDPGADNENVLTYDVTFDVTFGGDGISAAFVEATVATHNGDQESHPDLRDELDKKVSDVKVGGTSVVEGGVAVIDLSGKQDVIDDLSAIRSGAAAGGTAYQKPGTGIPASDLSSEVQDMIENGGKTKSVSVNGGTPVTPDANGQVDLTIEQANVTIGTVTTGEEGSNADVTNSGTPTAPVFNFKIPRGNTGRQGPKGPQGDSVIVGEGDLPLAHVTGQSTEKAMSQKGVTEEVTIEKSLFSPVWTTGKGIKPDTGDLYSNNAYYDYSSYINIEGCQMLRVPVTKISRVTGYAFYDASKTYISGGTYEGEAVATSDYQYYLVTPPNGAKYIRLTANSRLKSYWTGSYPTLYTVERVISKVAVLDDVLYGKKEIPASFSDGGGIYVSNGQSHNNSGLSRTSYLDVSSFQELVVPLTKSSYTYGIALYDGDKNFLESASYQGELTQGLSYVNIRTNGAKYLRVTAYSSTSEFFSEYPRVYAIVRKEEQQFANVQEFIDNSVGECFIPSGTYNISAPLVIPNGMAISGERGKTIFKLTGGTAIIDFSEASKDITISGITFDGGTAATPAPMEIANLRARDGEGTRSGIYATGWAKNIIIEECEFLNFDKAGITLYRNYTAGANHGDKIRIKDCTFKYNYIGLLADVRSEFNIITGCSFNSNMIGCLVEGGNNTIAQCRCEDNGTGFVLSGTMGENDSHGILTGCTANHNLGYSLACVDVNNGFIVDATAFTPLNIASTKGIVLSNSIGVNLVGCQIMSRIDMDTPRSVGYNAIVGCLMYSPSASGYESGIVSGDTSHLLMSGNKYFASDFSSIINNDAGYVNVDFPTPLVNGWWRAATLKIVADDKYVSSAIPIYADSDTYISCDGDIELVCAYVTNNVYQKINIYGEPTAGTINYGTIWTIKKGNLYILQARKKTLEIVTPSMVEGKIHIRKSAENAINALDIKDAVIANPYWEAPELTKEVIFSTAVDGAGGALRRIPSVVITNNGTYLAATEARSAYADNAQTGIALARKIVGGSWVYDNILPYAPGSYGKVMNPSFAIAQSGFHIGRIYLFFLAFPITQSNDGYAYLASTEEMDNMYIFSDDDGVTWSSPVSTKSAWDTDEWTWVGASPANGVDIGDGKLAMPTMGRYNDNWYSGVMVFETSDASSVYSKRSSKTADNESTLFVAPSGVVMLNARNENSNHVRSLYAYNPNDNTLQGMPYNEDPNEKCQQSICKCGDIYLRSACNPSSTGVRDNLTVYASNDGLTWCPALLVNKPTTYGYSVVDARNNTCVLVFENKGNISFVDLSEYITQFNNSAATIGQSVEWRLQKFIELKS